MLFASVFFPFSVERSSLADLELLTINGLPTHLPEYLLIFNFLDRTSIDFFEEE